MEGKPFTVSDLENMQCQEPGCKEPHEVLMLSPECHKGGPMWVQYRFETEQLELVCCTCKKLVAAIAVSHGMN